MQTKQQQANQLRSGLIIYPSQETTLQQHLHYLFKKTSANLILLVDITGQIIVKKGSKQENDLVALGALIAGDLAATREIAILSGELQPYQMTVREGTKYSTVVADINQIAALFIQTSFSILVDKVCTHVKEINPQISKVLDECLQNDLPYSLLSEKDPEQLNALLDQELNAMWME